MAKDWTLYALHILDCIEKIGEIQKRGSITNDFVLYDAILRNLQTLAESTTHIPEPFKIQHINIDWKNIAGFRNILVHDYLGDIDPKTVEKIVIEYIQPLKKVITQILHVWQSYDKIVEWFDEHRSRELFEKPWLDKAISLIPKSSKILDIGCGMGEPIAEYFIKQGFDLTGIDGSKTLINLAKSRFSKARFIISDMRNLNLNQRFDLVVVWHSLFHLSQLDQTMMFKIFANHLNNNGILLFTTGHKKGEVWSDNGGENLYHSSLDPSDYKLLLKTHDFELLDYKIEDQSCGEATVWLAKYIGKIL